jgi:hypothetical protein
MFVVGEDVTESETVAKEKGIQREGENEIKKRKENVKMRDRKKDRWRERGSRKE